MIDTILYLLAEAIKGSIILFVLALFGLAISGNQQYPPDSK